MWKITLYHLLQETKFKESSGFYETIVKKNYDNMSSRHCWLGLHLELIRLLQLLGISAIVLANLCVAYIMTGHTEEVTSLYSNFHYQTRLISLV